MDRHHERILVLIGLHIALWHEPLLSVLQLDCLLLLAAYIEAVDAVVEVEIVFAALCFEQSRRHLLCLFRSTELASTKVLLGLAASEMLWLGTMLDGGRLGERCTGLVLDSIVCL